MLTPSPFPTVKKLHLRLPKLERGGYLTRPARRIAARTPEPFELASATPRRGRPQAVWALAQRGADALHLAGDWNRNNSRLHPGAFAHPLAITRVFTTLQVAQAQRRISVESWTGENAWRTKIRAGRHTLPVVPDATCLLVDHDSDREAQILLEIDNHTEPLTRSTAALTSVTRKFLGYWHYWDQVVRPQEIGMIVLTVAKRRDYADRLRRAAVRVDPEGHGLNLFWFTSEEDWAMTDAESFLYRPIWTTAAGETRAIFGDSDS